MKDKDSLRLNIILDFGRGHEPINVGDCLWSKQEQTVSLKWSEDALSIPYRLSLSERPSKGVLIAKRDPFGGLPTFLSDSIPDGFGLRMMNNSFQKAGYSLREVNQVHRLAWVGSGGLGAITYTPALGFAFSKELLDIKDLGVYAKKADVDRFESIPTSAIHAGGSAHGARPKFCGHYIKMVVQLFLEVMLFTKIIYHH